MYKILASVLLIGIAASSPAKPILRKLDDLRYQHAIDSKGEYHLVDMWMTLDDIAETARYIPIAQNIYHLFTRNNPSISQPLVFGDEARLTSSNFDGTKRTIILIHGWRDNAVADFNINVVPAFLGAEDLNVIVLDWSAGASSINYLVALDNSITSGNAVAQFIDWLNQATGSNPVQYHIVGHGLGAHQAGIAARHASGDIPYVTGLDPSIIGWINHPDRFSRNDAVYTEVIYTNAGFNGFISNLAMVDFYPNGGESMPGCDSRQCDHAMSYYYFAESIARGGFTGRRCASYWTAIVGMCLMPGTLPLGGLRPKIGSAGIFYLDTNAAAPYSRG